MTLFEKLIAAGLPVLSATETGEIQSDAMTPAQVQQFQDILLEHFNPGAYADLLTSRADIQQIKDLYVTMINRLQQIQNAGAIPFTQAGFNQVVQAVKDEALYIERIMKALKRLVG